MGTDDLSLQPWVFGDSIAGSCPILQTSNNIAQTTTTVNCDNPVRPALCQIVNEVIQSFSTTLTITSSTATISITITSISTSTSSRTSSSSAQSASQKSGNNQSGGGSPFDITGNSLGLHAASVNLGAILSAVALAVVLLLR